MTKVIRTAQELIDEIKKITSFRDIHSCADCYHLDILRTLYCTRPIGIMFNVSISSICDNWKEQSTIDETIKKFWKENIDD